MYAIFNEACTFILLFLLEELLKSPRGLAFTLLCKLIRKCFFFFWLGKAKLHDYYVGEEQVQSGLGQQGDQGRLEIFFF